MQMSAGFFFFSCVERLGQWQPREEARGPGAVLAVFREQLWRHQRRHGGVNNGSGRLSKGLARADGGWCSGTAVRLRVVQVQGQGQVQVQVGIVIVTETATAFVAIP